MTPSAHHLQIPLAAIVILAGYIHSYSCSLYYYTAFGGMLNMLMLNCNEYILKTILQSGVVFTSSCRPCGIGDSMHRDVWPRRRISSVELNHRYLNSRLLY